MSNNTLPVAVVGVHQTVTVGTHVTLDGSGSYDPDHNTVLAYSWQMISRPGESAATLSDPSGPMPSFIADYPGTYVISLVVKDSQGLDSAPVEAVVSTACSAPVAEAGPDQLVRQTGTVIRLDGSTSYDPDGDPLLYHWEIIAKPDASQASLPKTQASTTSLVPDAAGDYFLRLTVVDRCGLSSSDTVRVSFSNTRPVAYPGNNQMVSLGDIVRLNGAGSYDADGDSLIFQWNIVSTPQGSGASLSNHTGTTTSFTADRQGMFVISLAVNDGLEESVSTITVTVTISHTEAMQMLRAAGDTINALGANALANQTMKNTLTNKLSAVIRLVDQGLYSSAADKLQNDILAKTDGCAKTGEPDQNDWITDCAAQAELYPLVLGAIQRLS